MTAIAGHTAASERIYIERAQALLPKLRERADAAEAARCIPAETISDFHDAGFFRLLQPKRWNGHEADPQTFFDVVIEVGSACPSSAWVLGVVAVHQWQMALFADEAQQEVWSDDTNTLISSSYMPAGKVTPVDGGYRFSGRWGFSSGCDHCQWAFLGGFVPPKDDKGVPDMRTFLLPRSDYTFDDDWFTSGLKATGSKTVVVDDVFVPEHRTHRMADGFRQKSPGHDLNTAPLYRLPFGQIFTRSVATPAIGIARGALEAYEEVTTKRVGRADGAEVVHDPASKEVSAEAALAIDEATTILHRDYDELMQSARSGQSLSMEDRVRYRYNASTATNKCVQAVDSLFTTSGGGAIFTRSKLNRFFQDIHAARGHYANNPVKSARNYGGVRMGQQTTDWFI